ncbi:MAG: hypothetical protein CSB21_02020 [Deltaproteobacteria bacterium]|nr:MAG: hypothetical protein CSB21_02020 [Deltaproteobacteria bacterium]
MKKFLLFLSLIFILVSGCSSKAPAKKTASELLESARKEYKDKDYIQAVRFFQQLRNWYPYSIHVKEAELKIADSYFAMKKYHEAISAYEYFLKLHPLNPEAHKAAFRIGEAYYKQILSKDRDQTDTKNALQSLKKFVHSYPESKYREKAHKYINFCMNRLADSRLYIANFYFKQKAYEASYQRLKDILKNFPGTEAYNEAMKKINKIPEKFKKE